MCTELAHTSQQVDWLCHVNTRTPRSQQNCQIMVVEYESQNMCDRPHETQSMRNVLTCKHVDDQNIQLWTEGVLGALSPTQARSESVQGDLRVKTIIRDTYDIFKTVWSTFAGIPKRVNHVDYWYGVVQRDFPSAEKYLTVCARCRALERACLDCVCRTYEKK